jgi:hypothetical protein
MYQEKYITDYMLYNIVDRSPQAFLPITVRKCVPIEVWGWFVMFSIMVTSRD